MVKRVVMVVSNCGEAAVCVARRTMDDRRRGKTVERPRAHRELQKPPVAAAARARAAIERQHTFLYGAVRWAL